MKITDETTSAIISNATLPLAESTIPHHYHTEWGDAQLDLSILPISASFSFDGSSNHGRSADRLANLGRPEQPSLISEPLEFTKPRWWHLGGLFGGSMNTSGAPGFGGGECVHPLLCCAEALHTISRRTQHLHARIHKYGARHICFAMATPARDDSRPSWAVSCANGPGSKQDSNVSLTALAPGHDILKGPLTWNSVSLGSPRSYTIQLSVLDLQEMDAALVSFKSKFLLPQLIDLADLGRVGD